MNLWLASKPTKPRHTGVLAVLWRKSATVDMASNNPVVSAQISLTLVKKWLNILSKYGCEDGFSVPLLASDIPV